MVAPYVTPPILLAAPTGISWSTIPIQGAADTVRLAVQTDLCRRVTAEVDRICHQPLRATITTDVVTGPQGRRVRVMPDGTVRIVGTRWPVTQVIGARISPSSAFPRQWQAIPADQLRPERPLLDVYSGASPGMSADGSSVILLAPGWLTPGDTPQDIEVTYLAAWPHTTLTADAASGARALLVDDITGWAGATGTAYGAASHDTVTALTATPVTAGMLSGPGTLGLAAPIGTTYPAGTLVSALPDTVMQAAIMLCVSQALLRGATATSVQTTASSRVKSTGPSELDIANEAAAMLSSFRRVV